MLFQQNHDASQVNKGFEAADQLVISHGDAGVMLELIEETLDQMAFLILPPITFPRILVVYFRRYGKSRTLFADEVTNTLGTVGLVSHNNASTDIDQGQNICGDCAVVDVPTRKQQFDRVAKRIDQRVNLCILPAARYADVLIGFRAYSPFFAPAAC